MSFSEGPVEKNVNSAKARNWLHWTATAPPDKATLPHFRFYQNIVKINHGKWNHVLSGAVQKADQFSSIFNPDLVRRGLLLPTIPNWYIVSFSSSQYSHESARACSMRRGAVVAQFTLKSEARRLFIFSLTIVRILQLKQDMTYCIRYVSCCYDFSKKHIVNVQTGWMAWKISLKNNRMISNSFFIHRIRQIWISLSISGTWYR